VRREEATLSSHGDRCDDSTPAFRDAAPQFQDRDDARPRAISTYLKARSSPTSARR